MFLARRLLPFLLMSFAVLHPAARAQEARPTLDGAIAALPDAGEATSQAKRIRATPALWVVRDVDTTIYLFGTLHLMKPQIDWFEGPIRAAYAASDEVVTELGVVDEGAIGQLLVAKAANREGPPVTPDLSDAQRARLTDALSAAGMPPAAGDAFKPWFTAMILTVSPLKKLGFDPKLGVDATIQDQAKADGKPVRGLETPEQQFDLFDGLPRALQVQLLVSTLDEADKLSERVEAMLGQWTSGNAVAIADMLNEQTAGSADLARLLLTERNARWADWIAARMEQPGTVFIAVGAGHLAGKDSVQDALAVKGIASERVPQE